jgi:hypothetical protein
MMENLRAGTPDNDAASVPSSDADATAEPTAAPKRGRWVLAVLAGVGALAVAGGVTAAVLARDADEDPMWVKYTIEVLGGECGADTGYDDIATGTDVEVTDGSGNMLGVGSLRATGDCTFVDTFELTRRSEDGFYRVTSGNESRGYLSYTEDDLTEDGDLIVFATLGG